MKMENSGNKASRKVRFNLPDIAPESEGKWKSRKEHGTVSYVNGTLMTTTKKVPFIEQRKVILQPDIVTVTKIINPVPPLSIPTTIHIKNPVTVSCIKQSVKLESDMIPTKHTAQPTGVNYRIRVPTVARVYDVTTLERKKFAEKIEDLKARHIVVLNDSPLPKVKPVKMYDCQTICDKFSRFRLFEDVLTRKRKILEKQGTEHQLKNESSSSTKTKQWPQSTSTIHQNLFSHENHSGIVSDLIHRWKRLRHKEENKRENEVVTGGYESTKTFDGGAAVSKDPLEILTSRKRSRRSVVS